MSRAATACALALALAACDGPTPPDDPDAGSGPPDTGPPLVLGDIDVSAEANLAMFEGRFLVGAFLHEVPQTPPVALQRLQDPTFPLEVTLRGLEPGRYWVVGVVDYDPPSATLPGTEDYTVTSEPVDVMGDDVQTVSLTFDIPPEP